MKWQQDWTDTKKSELTLKYQTYRLLEYIHGTSQDGNKMIIRRLRTCNNCNNL